MFKAIAALRKARPFFMVCAQGGACLFLEFFAFFMTMKKGNAPIGNIESVGDIHENSEIPGALLFFL
ncbi:MAG: hypothetical protein JXR70_04940 [Spirochaetales bacterium]|nr:hypothetical protein [Spirochaetales bacterium]